MKVGDYVRTKDGIERIKDIKEWVNFQGYEKIITTDKNQYETLYKQSEIIKSSPNIIDLIEVGDLIYVDISPDDCGGIIVPRIAETENELNLFKQLLEKDWIIKSIVTREQLGSNKYKVGE